MTSKPLSAYGVGRMALLGDAVSEVKPYHHLTDAYTVIQGACNDPSPREWCWPSH